MLKIAAGVLSLALVAPAVMPAQDHVVSPSELRKDVHEASKSRQENASRLRRFLGSDTARNAVGAAKLDAGRIERAIAALSDEELARLASKSQQLENDFAAGRLTSSQITYIILGAILIIIVAIVA
ncbi:MAG TPA: hypothetical protein VN428_19210 [Bryobacteraceae bacterium]|nr:hypothetical protein [Bryobacteraceae bacterium]